MRPECPFCHEPLDYHGLDDGGGDYGEDVCDQWECPYCDYSEEGGCLEFDDSLEDEPGTYFQPVELDDDSGAPRYSPPPRDMDDIPF